MLTNFQAAINAVAAEKNLDPQIIFEAIEAALVAAYKREYGDREMNVEVKFDPVSEQSTVYRIWKVVKTASDIDSEEDGKFTQLPLSQAKKLKKNAKVGDEIREDVTPMDYGRIAAQSAKQVIIQKLRSAENEMIAEYYKDKIGEVVPALVKRIVDNGDVEVEVERTQALLFRSKLIPGEKIRTGSRIKVYIEDIKESSRGSHVILTRIHPEMVRQLLELEIPEVAEEKVEVKAIAREPGVRTKIAVASNDDTIDPVGSCVGQKGVRIQGVMDEINNEYVDMIEWTDDQKEMLRRSLAPAKITGIHIDDQETPPRAKVYMEEDQRSLAIGKAGQNVRLASILTGMEIDVLNIPDWEKVLKEEIKIKKATTGKGAVKSESGTTESKKDQKAKGGKQSSGSKPQDEEVADSNKEETKPRKKALVKDKKVAKAKTKVEKVSTKKVATKKKKKATNLT